MDTIRLPPDFSEFLKLFVAHEVRFLLIGGYAVNAFGYSRNTGDMAIWIASDDENQKRAIRAIRARNLRQCLGCHSGHTGAGRQPAGAGRTHAANRGLRETP